MKSVLLSLGHKGLYDQMHVARLNSLISCHLSILKPFAAVILKVFPVLELSCLPLFVRAALFASFPPVLCLENFHSDLSFPLETIPTPPCPALARCIFMLKTFVDLVAKHLSDFIIMKHGLMVSLAYTFATQSIGNAESLGPSQSC